MTCPKITTLQTCFVCEKEKKLTLITCIESALISSPLKRLANSSDSFVLPVPVAPRITTTGFLTEAAILNSYSPNFGSLCIVRRIKIIYGPFSPAPVISMLYAQENEILH